MNKSNIPRLISSAREMQDFSKLRRSEGKKIGFVPTLGALHVGHLSLVSRANEIADITVVSIFVNPMQFGENEDFDEYIRDLDGDMKKLSEFDVAALFVPELSEIYPEGFQTSVEVTVLQKPLCGSFRAGHFKGVTTVVLKLFNMVIPDFVVFGRKDYQQLKIVEQMVKDLNIDIQIISVPIVREHDGLAMSSRNNYLSKTDRSSAAYIYKALSTIKESFDNGCDDVTELITVGNDLLLRHGIDDIDYLEIRDGETLDLIKKAVSGSLVAVAVRFGETRLIDNISL